MSAEAKAKAKIGCLLASGFEDSELRIPCDRLRAAGYPVEIIANGAGETLTGGKGRVRVRADLSIDDADPDDYEGLLIPGGYSPEHLRADERFVAFVQAFDDTRRPLAAACNGSQLLLTAQPQRRLTLTTWTDEPVVVDENWITSRHPGHLEAFSAKFIEELAALEEAVIGFALSTGAGGPTPS
jgi:protease I